MTPPPDVLRERIGALLDLMAETPAEPQPVPRVVERTARESIVVYDARGETTDGRIISSWFELADGWHVLPPREGAPPAIVDLGGGDRRGLVMFGRDGWELHRWGEPVPRAQARCLCPEAGASQADPS